MLTPRLSLQIFSFLFIFSMNSYSATEMPFGDAKTLFSQMDQQYQQNVLAVENTRDTEVAQIDQKIIQLKADQAKCPDFSCASQIKEQISNLENQKIEVVKKADKSVEPLRLKYTREAKELALASFSYELKATALSFPELENFTVKTDSGCAGRYSSYYNETIQPSKQMVCRQLNVEYKLKGKFVSASLAIGLYHGAFDHRGDILGVDDREVREARFIFSQTKEKFLDGVHPLYIFGKDSKYLTSRPTWADTVEVGVGDYGRLKNHYYYMYNGAVVGFTYVKFEEI